MLLHGVHTCLRQCYIVIEMMVTLIGLTIYNQQIPVDDLHMVTIYQSTHGYTQTIITHGEQNHTDQELVKMIHNHFQIFVVLFIFEASRKHNYWAYGNGNLQCSKCHDRLRHEMIVSNVTNPNCYFNFSAWSNVMLWVHASDARQDICPQHWHSIGTS